jgi:hypothetical protein
MSMCRGLPVVGRAVADQKNGSLGDSGNPDRTVDARSCPIRLGFVRPELAIRRIQERMTIFLAFFEFRRLL